MSESRRPPKAPGNIEPLATLPVFLKLDGRRALVAGGTPPAVWKAELLAAAGAEVVVMAAAPCAEMEELAEALPGRVRLHRRGWTPDDLSGAALAIGAFEDDEGEVFRDAARAAGIPVNVIDVPPLCDFQFGTIIGRSPLVIGISTDGAAPVFGQALRARIEALLPPAIGAWARAAKAWREPLQALQLGFAARRRFWERFADMALEGGDRLPQEADRQACMEAAVATETARRGRVILVGIGPGAAEDITLGAVRAMQSADVILYDQGVAPAILGLGRREARRVAVPDKPSEVLTLLRDALDVRRTVAWVGPGDATTCLVWTGRAAWLRASRIDDAAAIDVIRGARCATCPNDCAVADGLAPGGHSAGA